jgi:uncharacterized RDD family membrane protein YckC
VADDRRYARLSRRLQANCIDVVVSFHTPLAGLCFVTWFGGPLAGPLAALMALTPVVLEPILVARTGATVGHRLFGLRVVEIATGRPPGLLTSFARYFAKGACLGPSLAPIIAITRRHQGIHDLLCGTVVEVVDPESRKGRLAAYDPVLDARTATLGARVLSTLGYALAIAGAVVIVLLARVVACGPEGGCGRAGEATLDVAARVSFVLMYAVVWLGPAGRLPGAR